MKLNKKVIIFAVLTAMLISIMPASFVQAENLAGGATIVSGVYNRADSTVTPSAATIAKMFDDDNTTYLKASTVNISGEFIIDLNAVKEFNRVTIYKPNDTNRPFKLTVEVSNDNSVWTDALEGTDVPAQKETELIYDFSKVSGRYVKFTVHDITPAGRYYGFAISELRLFMIPDTTPPVITLEGDEVIELELGDEYVEPGYSAEDNIDGDLTESVFVSGDTVNTQVRGTYIVRYNVTDEAGNAAEEKTRTVNVGIDRMPPVITLAGDTVIDLNIGDEYVEPGYSAEDSVDGDLTESVIVSGDVNTQLKGTYIIRYNVTDEAGNAAEEQTRTVYVGIDRTPPVITLKGSNVIEIGLGGVFIEPGYTAYDDFDGNITERVVVSGDTVDVNTAGTYTIKYDVSDEAGNSALTVTRTVKVVENLYGNNLCLGAQLINGGSGGGDTVKANLFDGDVATRYQSWTSSNGIGEFILDLGESKSFNQMVVIQSDSSAVAFKVSLQTGESEAGPWEETIASTDVADAAGKATTTDFDTVNARYVRFYIEQPEGKVYRAAELQLYMDESSYIISNDINALDVPDKTGVSLALPDRGIYGSDIEWKSSDTRLISNSGQIVSRPTIAEGEKTVTLTAELSFGETTAKKEITITLTPKNPAEDAVITGGSGASALGDGNYETTFTVADGSSVEIDLDKAQHLGVATLEIASENKISGAAVYAYSEGRYVPVGEYQPMARSAGNLLIKFDRGTYEKLKIEFQADGDTAVSELILGMTDKDAVDYLAEILTVSDESATQITKDLILTKSGDYGQKVEWKSDNTSVLLDNGTVIQGTRDVTTSITATVTKGTETATRSINVTILKKTTTGSFDTGSGGGGGGKQIPFTKPQGKTQTEMQTGAVLGVSAAHWAFDYVKKLAELGIVSGNENGDFEPDKEITRAEYIKILISAFDIKKQGEAKAFNDVSDRDWYAEFISVARNAGIVTGDENNCVMPNSKISRQDMAVMLGRTMKITGKSLRNIREYDEFSDSVQISDYAKEHIKVLYCAEILDGMGNGEFLPKNSATKAQAAKIIVALL